MEELATTGTLHRFVPNVKFSRLQRSLKKIHSEELDSEVATNHFGRSVHFFRRKMLSERPGLWVKISTVKVKSFFESPHCHCRENRENSAYGLVI